MHIQFNDVRFKVKILISKLSFTKTNEDGSPNVQNVSRGSAGYSDVY